MSIISMGLDDSPASSPSPSPCSPCSPCSPRSRSPLASKLKRHKASRAGKTRPKKQSTTTPRPMNAFMLWQREHRPLVLVNEPALQNHMVSIKLGEIWKEMVLKDKDQLKKYQEKEQKEKMEHKKLYPNYKYSPKKKKSAPSSAVKRPAGIVFDPVIADKHNVPALPHAASRQQAAADVQPVPASAQPSTGRVVDFAQSAFGDIFPYGDDDSGLSSGDCCESPQKVPERHTSSRSSQRRQRGFSEVLDGITDLLYSDDCVVPGSQDILMNQEKDVWDDLLATENFLGSVLEASQKHPRPRHLQQPLHRRRSPQRRLFYPEPPPHHTASQPATGNAPTPGLMPDCSFNYDMISSVANPMASRPLPYH